MKKKNMILNLNSDLIFILILILIIYSFEASSTHKSCKPSGHMTGTKPPPGKCNTENDSECCVAGKEYTTYTCSPHVSCKGTKAVLTINSFEEGGDGGGPSECDSKYHSDDKPVVALSTGWYKQGQMCNKTITIINGINGLSVKARVVDECDSTVGCDHTHAYQPPCPHNIVDGSKAVWEALGLNTEDGEIDVTWMDRDACRS